MRTSTSRYLPSALLAAFVLTQRAAGSPQLSLYLNPSTATEISSESVTLANEPQTLTLDVHLNTDGHKVDELQFYINAATTYAAAPTVTNPPQSPFVEADVETNISSGTTASSGGQLILFNSTPSFDYPAGADEDVVSVSFAIASLPAGSYRFHVVGESFANSTEGTGGYSTSTFAAPGDFTLTVTPEPGTFAIVTFTAGGCLVRRRRHGARKIWFH